jgi:hypothetical protein
MLDLFDRLVAEVRCWTQARLAALLQHFDWLSDLRFSVHSFRHTTQRGARALQAVTVATALYAMAESAFRQTLASHGRSARVARCASDRALGSTWPIAIFA